MVSWESVSFTTLLTPPVYDCPDLEANIGDICYNADQNEGVIDEECECYVTPIFDCPDLGLNIGDACNDGNPDTENDIVTEDCECMGTEIVVPFDCPDLGLNIGDACDDGNPDTENDIVTEDCECVGTEIVVPFDCPELGLNIGDACDDGNPDTENDIVNDDCECIGTEIVVPFDCPDLALNIGDACDDGNPDTENDIVTEDCECLGTEIVEEPCGIPYDVELTRTSGTTATFMAGNTDWHYQGSANRSGRPLRPYPMYGMNDMTVPHTQYALVPSFSYDIWLRTICGDGSFSAWAGPFDLPTFGGMARRAPSMSLTPNPAVAVVSITRIEARTIEVFDMNGGYIKTFTTTDNQFDMTGLPTGKYNLRVIDAQGAVHFDQVIKK